GLVNVSNDEELALAIEIYNYFRRVLAFANGNGDEVFLSGSEANLPVPTEFQDDVAASLDAAAIAIKDAIDGNNTLCADNASFAALKNVLYWQQQAETLGIATADNGLDRATLKLFLCVDPVIEGVELPAVMQDGFPHSLDVTCGLRFGDGSPQGAPFQINVTATGADVQHPTGFTDSQGHYTTVITATGNEAVTVNVQACLVLPGTTTPTFICETAFDVSSQGLDLTGDYIGTGPLGFDFTTMHVTQNQNAVSGSFESRSALEHHTGTFTATLSGTQLLGVDIELDGGACAITAPGFTGDVILDGNRQTVRLLFDGRDCHGHSMGGIVVCGPHSSVNAIDLSGQWLGSVALDIQDGNLPVTLQLTGGIGHVTGSFTGGRSGSFSADIVQDPNPGGCVFAKLTNIAIDFSDCPLIKSNLELEDGCVEIRNGTVNMSLSTHAQWADGCNHRDFTGFSFARQVNICTGN
ncbi:MAG TPA: hypothetical protein VJS69_00180, partial [Candidatus Krumholzibacteria bacterium]|nr:hypothetical protein [Candidatus Krumholzibacteria bacterium]